MNTSVNTTEKTPCIPPADFADYLYGEVAFENAAILESHLLECDSCTDEFADLSLARLGVYEWNRDEFAHIETPLFIVPTEVEPSFIESVRAFFASHVKSLVPATIAAVLLTMFGLFVWSADRVDNTLDGGSLVVVEQKDAAAPNQSARASVPDQVKIESTITPVSVKTAVVKKPKRLPTLVKQKSSSPVERNFKKQIQRPILSPRLNDFDDVDDNTLRLSDLVAEADTL